MAILDGDAMQLIILLAQGLWAVVLWQFGEIKARLAQIEQALQEQQLDVVRDYTLQTDHDKLRDRVHAIAGNVQTLKAYNWLAKNGHMSQDASSD